MEKRSIRSILLIVLFCIYLGMFAVLYVALPKEEFSENEKRVLAKFPEVSLKTVLDGSFESGYEKWLSDHVPGRNLLVGVNAVYEQMSGRNGLSGFVRGSDGYLFAAPEAMDAEAVESRLKRINALAEAIQLPMDVMLIPDSGYILDAHMPLVHAPYCDSDLANAMRAGLSENIGFIWPEERFDSLAGEQLYYRTDHHLTSRGSYEAYRFYAESVGAAVLPADAYSVETVEGFYGSMYSKSGLWNTAPDKLEIWRSGIEDVTVSFDDRESADDMFFTDHLYEMDKYPVFLDGNHGLVTIDTGKDTGENLLIIRDSFGHCFAPFAADAFDSVVLVDLRYYKKPVSELVKQMEIDRVLVLYGAENFITDSNFVWLK